MSRLSDALRRAGHQEEQQAAARLGDIGEYAAETPGAIADQTGADRSGESDAPPSEMQHADTAPRSKVASTYILAAPEKRDRVSASHAPQSNSREDIQILDAMAALYRYRWLMTAVIAVSLSAAAVYNRLAPRVYETQARLLLEPNSQDIVPMRSSTEDLGRTDYYVTQLEVLRSPSTVRRTLEKLQLLDADPKGQSGQIGQLIRGLKVVPVKSDMGESRVISISFKSTDPELAARIANGLAQTYVEGNLDARRQGSRDAFQWLNQRLADLRREVQESQGALQQYRERTTDAVSLGDQQNIVAQKLAQLNALVTNVRTDRLEKQALFEQLKSIQERGVPLDTFSPIQSNSFIQGLKADLAGLERERQQLAERLGDLHPDMIKVNTSIANAQRRLSDEMAKVVEAIQNDYRTTAAKERALAGALEDQKREVLSLSQKSIGYSALQRDNASTQQMLDTVLQRVKETELAAEMQSNNAKILDAAEVPRGPILPRAQLNLIIALLGGTFIAAALAFGVDYMNPRIAEPGDVTEALGLPLLGIAPKLAGLKNRPAMFDALPSSFQEALRVIRTRIFLSPIAGHVRSMAVTSTHPGEGKTLVASNLAVSIAMSGRRVLLVDADLRRPQLHSIFNVAKSPGLSDVIAGQAKSTDVVRGSVVPGLFLLPAGAHVRNPTDLLDSEHLNGLLHQLSEQFDVVVLDCPPVMAVADASIIANVASSVLFVVGSGTTSRKAAQVAIDRVTSVQGNVVGVVLNKAKVNPRSEYYATPKYLTDDMVPRKFRSVVVG